MGRETGSRIGRFAVLEMLGQGGMGVVYAGYDDRLDRRIALKVLRPGRGGGRNDEQGLVREAQAMARISHPNVVTVHEVGRSGEEVFIVMEFIRGQTVSQWLQGDPSWEEVRAVFVEAGQGLQAAHDLGMVHRDFKPANVMRSEGGVVKVLDFGLSTEGSFGEDGNSGVVVGTTAYMPPEQHKGFEFDARGDQYSYCASFWEALTGRLPFGAGDAAQVLRAKQGGAPAWPADAPRVPGRLVAALRRGLAPVPDARWPSMHALVLELKRDPRRRRRVWSLGLGGVALIGFGGSAVQAWAGPSVDRCSGAREQLAGVWDDGRRAQVEAAMRAVNGPDGADAWARSDRELTRYADDWVAKHTEACQAATGSDAGEQLFDAQMRCLSRARISLDAIADTLVDADARVVAKAGEVVASLRPLRWCEDVEALEAEVEPPLPHETVAVENGRKALARADSERTAGRPEASWRSVEEATGLLAGVRYTPARAELLLERGRSELAQGRYLPAEASLTHGFELALKSQTPEVVRGATLALLYAVGIAQGNTEAALRYWPLVAPAVRNGEPGSAAARTNLATILDMQSQYKRAEVEHRAALRQWESLVGPQGAEVCMARNNLGANLLYQGKTAASAVQFRAAAQACEQALGPDHHDVGMARLNIGVTLQNLGKHTQAVQELQEAIAILTKAFGLVHPWVATARHNLGRAFVELGRYEEAEREHRAAVQAGEETLGPTHPRVSIMRDSLGAVFMARGDYEAAEAEHRRALRTAVAQLGPNHRDVATYRRSLGMLFEVQGRDREAEREYREALRVDTDALGSEHPALAVAELRLGMIKRRQGLLAEALPWLRKAWSRFEAVEASPEEKAQAAFALARTLWSIPGAQRDRAHARELAAYASKAYAAADIGHEDERRRVEAWLGANEGL